MSAATVAPAPGSVPRFVRRVACMVYEGVLLFGVVMAVGLVYATATDQRHALAGTWGLQLSVFVAVGAYFVWLWSHGGQTLAMRAWRLQVVADGGSPPGAGRALLRYLLAWLWFLPALALIDVAGLRGGWPTAATLGAGMVLYAALAWTDPHRRLPHERLSGTRLVVTAAA